MMARHATYNRRAVVARVCAAGILAACGGDSISQIVSRHDLGDIQVGDLVQHRFVIANDSGTLWKVEETRKSCGCMVGEVSKRVGPGEELHVDVGVTLASEGAFGVTFEVILESGRQILCVLSGRAVGGVHVKPGILAIAGGRATSEFVLRYPGVERPGVSVDTRDGWLADIGQWRAAGAYQELPIMVAYQHQVPVQRRERIWLDLTHDGGKKEEVSVFVVLGEAKEWPVSPRVLAVRGVRGSETPVRATVHPSRPIDQCLLRTGSERRTIPFKQHDEGVEVSFHLSAAVAQEVIFMAGEDEIVLPVAKVWE